MASSTFNFESWVNGGVKDQTLEFGLDVITPLYAKTFIRPTKPNYTTNKPTFALPKAFHKGASSVTAGALTNVYGDKPLDRVGMEYETFQVNNTWAISREHSLVELRGYQGGMDSYISSQIADELDNVLEVYENQTISDFANNSIATTSTTDYETSPYQLLLEMIEEQETKGSRREDLLFYVKPSVLTKLKLDAKFARGCDVTQDQIQNGWKAQIEGIGIITVPAMAKVVDGKDIYLVDMSRWYQVVNNDEGNIIGEFSPATRWKSIIISGRAWYCNIFKKSYECVATTTNGVTTYGFGNGVADGILSYKKA